MWTVLSILSWILLVGLWVGTTAYQGVKLYQTVKRKR